MAENYLDFDQFLAELDRKPKVIKIFGEEHEFPPALPADIMVRLLRVRAERGDMADLQVEEVLDLSERLLGRERLEHLLARGIDVEALGLLIAKIFELYGEQAQELADQVTQGNRASRRAAARGKASTS